MYRFTVKAKDMAGYTEEKVFNPKGTSNRLLKKHVSELLNRPEDYAMILIMIDERYSKKETTNRLVTPPPISGGESGAPAWEIIMNDAGGKKE